MSDTFALMNGFRFLDFKLNDQTRRLTQGTKDVAIGARAFDLLSHLVSNRDRVVSRDEIMDIVWPGTVVGENNLNVQVANLRCILGTNAITTVPGHGFRFGLEIETRAPLPERSSVVILPFSNLCGDPALYWLTDGFVEDITTELPGFATFLLSHAIRHSPTDRCLTTCKSFCRNLVCAT